MRGMGIALLSAEVGEDEWSLLLAAFLGCFVADAERGVGAGAGAEGSLHTRAAAGAAGKCALSGVRRALRYLAHDGDALRARRALERVVEALAEEFWRPSPSPPQPPQREAGVFPHSTAAAVDATLPAELLYMVYYLAYTQCAPQAWQAAKAHGRWAQLFFEPLLSASATTATTSTTKTEATASTKLFSSQAHGIEGGGRAAEDADVRAGVTRLFSQCMPNSEVANLLLFIDAYHAWLMRDYRGVLDHTEQLFQRLPIGGGTRPWLLWLMLHSSRFIHACAAIAVTNVSHPAARDVVSERVRRMRDEDTGGDARLRYRSPVWGVGASLHARPPLMRAVYDLLHSELSRGDDTGLHEKGADSCLHDEEHSRPPTSAEVWQDTFLLTLRAWLRAKRLTEAGHMTDSRDLLLRVLERLYGHRRTSSEEGHSFLTVSAPAPAAASAVTNSACLAATASGAAREEASSSVDEDNGCVGLRLMPSLWLRQLLLVNCAALADTRTLLYFLHHLRQPLALAELLYLAACPTIASGGVHSPILASFSMDETSEVQSVPHVKEPLQEMPLPVRVPLLSHRLWRLRRQLLQKSPQSTGECAEDDDHRVSLQREMMHLCAALVRNVRGLFGSLELSFTDCVPHRIVFDAITVACDVQENILRNAAFSLATAPLVSPPASPRSSGSSIEEDTHATATELPNTSATATNTPASLPPVFITASEGGSPSHVAPVTHACHYGRSSRNDNNPCHTDDGNSDDDGDSWLQVPCLPFVVSPSEVSHATSFGASVAVTAQELYWFAYRKAHEWIQIIQCSFPQLPLMVQLCQLRVAAAAFDKGTAHLARHLLATYRGNALVASHVALALFASLHVVSAERCIQEALQQHPHSAEIRRIYCAICGQNIIAREAMQGQGGEWDTPGRAKKRFVRPIFTHRYRGVLTVKYVTSDHHGHAAVYVPLAMCLLCIGALVAGFVLHLRDVAPTATTTIPTDDAGFRWSFALPSTLSTYLGFVIVVYALTAAAVNPLLASRCADAGDQIHHISGFLCALMEWNCLEDDAPNQLVFCLRGLPLVNLFTGVQLAVSNALRLTLHTGKHCASNNAVIFPDICNRIFTGWGTVQILLAVFLLAIAVLFHGRAWRVIRRRDVLVGSFATFITIFLIDVALFLFYFPLHFLSCVMLEPILFFINLVLTVAFASPLITEHFPSAPSDRFLATATFPRPTPTVAGRWGSMALSAEQVASQVRGRLRAGLPPLHWSPSRRHDCSMLCFHEVLQPLGKGGGDASHSPSGLLLQVLRGLASRGVAGCASLQSVVNWRAHRAPQLSEAAVQLALLRESFTAAVAPAPASASFMLNGVLGATAAVEADKQVSRFA
ncbi:uncharacterized protein Tco025E_09099, partial [Trypanosoma conorhini]